MRASVCLLAVLAGLATTSSASAEAELVLGRRSPLALVTITSAGEQAHTRTSALVAALTELLRTSTDFELLLLEDAIPRSCEGAIGCMTRRIRTDYDHTAFELPSGEVLPFSDHLERTKRDRSIPKLLLVVSNFVKPGASDRIFVLLVDLERALRIHHEADRRVPDWRETSDARIDEEAVLVRTPRVEMFGEEDMRAFLQKLVEVDLRPVFQERGHWRPFGDLEISGTAAGSTVRVDGDTAGLSTDGQTIIREISAGVHTLSLEAADGTLRRFDVVIEAGQTKRLLVEREVVASERSSFRAGLFYGGLGLAAVGTVITTVALAFASGSVDRVCFEGGACSSRASFAGTGQESVAGLLEPSQSGPLLGPLGYSLMLSGGIFSLGTVFLTEEDETPWLPLVLGIAAGGLSYGLSAALGGSP